MSHPIIRAHRALLVVATLSLPCQPAVAQDATVPGPMVPPIAAMSPSARSELRDAVERFTLDGEALARRYDTDYSPERRSRLRQFHAEWQSRLAEVDFEQLGAEGRIDWILLDNRARYELELLRREDRLWREIAPLLPFGLQLIALQDARRRFEPIDPQVAGSRLTAMVAEVERTKAGLEKALGADSARMAPGVRRPSRIVAFRAAEALDGIRRAAERWHGFYAGYDPLFTWWTGQPWKRLDTVLRDYQRFLREKLVGYKEGEDPPIVGDPIGAAGLAADLAVEMIPYTAAELLAIGEREFAWCEGEMKRAARDMGFGEDWKAALEKVKNSYVAPGRQTDVVRDLAREALAFVTSRNLVTVPPLADEVWRMEMMSPERQKVNPFFLGGEVIQVSYPTDAMDDADKLMSMRGNNPNFSKATVHHELIPGHHLQGFMNDRYNSHRQVFGTPFWHEGNSLYWEMILWDAGFPTTPEQRVGMLFWRMHRAARIVFSLSFHLGTMTPQQAIDLLVDRVGHERANATAEVRRSFNGTYSPLYQAGYMLGGLQQRSLRRELVESGRMSDREFHDAILQGGPMPIELVRARLTGQVLARDYIARWRF